MDNNQTQDNKPSAAAEAKVDKQMSTEQVLLEILDNSRKTKRYMAWQFYITIVLVVLPILAMAFLLPMALKSLGSLGNVYLNGLQ